MLNHYYDKKNKFFEVFNPQTGFYMRSGIIENGKDTGVDPFMRSFPALIDVGIMGHCVHGKSGLCMKSGVQCYQNGLKVCNPNMTLENYKKIIDEGKKKGLQQVALGGAGDPDMHENFEQILQYSVKNNIIPNFTTSGLGMTVEKAKICKKYCGAVAVSMYSRLTNNTPMIAIRKRGKNEVKTPYSSVDDIPVKFTFGNINKECIFDAPSYVIDKKVFSWDEVHHLSDHDLSGEYELYRVFEENQNPNYTFKTIDILLKEKIKTNIHFVLGNNTIDEAITRLKYNGFPSGINAVIFLLHKPVGLGTFANMLRFDDPRVKEFFDLIDKGNYSFKIGFDSCTVPSILNFTKNIDVDSIDTCEGARYSCYITPDMKMLPCSFDNQDLKWAYDISNDTIQNAWNSDIFEDFRNHFRNSCPDCKKRHLCYGGCPIRPQITLCKNKEQK